MRKKTEKEKEDYEFFSTVMNVGKTLYSSTLEERINNFSRFFNGIEEPRFIDMNLGTRLFRWSEIKEIKGIKKTAKKLKKGVYSVPVPYDDDILNMISSTLGKLKKSDLSFLPSSESHESFIKQYQDEFNRLSILFLTNTLPYIHNIFGINTKNYENNSIRYMDQKNYFMRNFTANYYDHKISQIEDKIDKFKAKKTTSKQKKHRKKLEDKKKQLIKNKKFLLDIIEKETSLLDSLEIKGVNLTYHKKKSLDDKSPVIFYSIKTNDQTKQSIKFLEQLIGLSEDKIKINLNHLQITDNFGLEIVVKKYNEKIMEKIYRDNRFTVLSNKSEKELEGLKNENIIDKRYKNHFKHKRIKLYDNQTGFIVDLHFTDIIGKNIKDSLPGMSHQQYQAGKLNKLYKTFGRKGKKIINQVKSFLEQVTLIRGHPYELEYFSSNTDAQRKDFLLASYIKEIRSHFSQKQIDTILSINPQYKTKKNIIIRQDKLDNVELGTEKLRDIQVKINLSVVIDLMFNEIRNLLKDKAESNIFVAENSQYGIDDSLNSLIEKAYEASSIHRVIYFDTIEGKDWKYINDMIYGISDYLESIKNLKNNVNDILVYAESINEFTEKLCKIDEAANILFDRKNFDIGTTKSLDFQVEASLLTQLLGAYNNIFLSYDPSNSDNQDKIEQIKITYKTINKKFEEIKDFLEIPIKSQFSMAQNKFNGNYLG